MIPMLDINLREILRASLVVKQLVNLRYRILVLEGDLVQVNAKPLCSVLILRKQHASPKEATRRFYLSRDKMSIQLFSQPNPRSCVEEIKRHQPEGTGEHETTKSPKVLL